MFLRSLSLRGFKSFADRTTVDFEPGVSVVVGPNGSGKSNIVDAISWVLGEQGPRSLRGGKMEDVIFAGSRLRPALGLAEVSLTIDNTSGLLPIEFGEVTLSRLLFRAGESEYRINGAACRLIDIQELLSDTGIGREQHTIIGQGQLDAILASDPVTLRGFIEEAAGVAKHRRRKERALRKIEASEANVGRLSDLLSDIRRRLRPLRAQSEIAKRYASMEQEAKRIHVVLGARELSALAAAMGGESIDVDAPIREGEERLAELEASIADADAARAGAFEESEQLGDALWTLRGQKERLDALIRLAAERSRGLEAQLGATTQAGARARVAELRREMEELSTEIEEAASLESLAARVSEETRRGLEEAEEAVRRADRAVAGARGVAREVSAETMALKSEVAALRASTEAVAAEGARTTARRASVESRLAAARRRMEECSREVAGLEEGEGPQSEEMDRIEAQLAAAEAESSHLVRELRAAEKTAASAAASTRLRETSEAVARRLVAKGGEGVAGILADLVDAEGEARCALDAIAGDARAVVVVESGAAGMAARPSGDTPVAMLMTHPQIEPPPGLVPLSSLVRTKHPAAKAALSAVFVAPGAEECAALAEEYPQLIFVSTKGAVAFGRLAITEAGSVSERAASAEAEAGVLEVRLSGLEKDVAGLKTARDEQAKILNQADAAIAAAAERSSAAEREVHALDREQAAISEATSEAGRSAGALSARLEAADNRLPEYERKLLEAEEAVAGAGEDLARRRGEHQLRTKEFDEARLDTARSGERRKILEERRETIISALERAETDEHGVQERRERIAEGIRDAASVTTGASQLIEEVQLILREAEQRHRAARAKAEDAGRAAAQVRAQRGELARELESLRLRAREEDLGRSEQRIRARILEERMTEQWGVDPAETVRLYGHVWEVEDTSRLEERIEQLAAMDDDALRRRLARVERDLESMGRVNPLAEQEFDELCAREEFLNAQIADVRRSRRDLFKIVAEVDSQVREMFGGAFEETAREYERLFALLFPGGAGRLRLTDPRDLLTAGIEVEARPGGKNLRRLSLLSGGEKALSALAVLFAIFRARPSPFYVLDEVEAALDDVNLHRFLTLIREFRSTSQLIVVTHQKRTMEAADVLYGVSIRPDGASRMLSQRLPSDATLTGGRLASESPR